MASSTRPATKLPRRSCTATVKNADDAPRDRGLSARDPFDLRVTRSTIHRLLKRNQIPAFRIGRHWRFNLEEIENWCASHASNKHPNAEG